MKKVAVGVVLMLLSGCGDIEWFPEPQTEATTPVTQPSVETKPVGNFVASVRVGAGNYTVNTTRGAFATYTSLTVPVATAVSMETFKDPATGLLIGSTLRAAGNTLLVRQVLALVE